MRSVVVGCGVAVLCAAAVGVAWRRPVPPPPRALTAPELAAPDRATPIAATPRAPEATSAPPRLLGTVVDGDGSACPFARIEPLALDGTALRGAPSTRADAAGRFGLARQPGAMVRLLVTHPDHAPHVVTRSLAPACGDVDLGSITLSRGGRVRARVLGVDAASASVMLTLDGDSALAPLAPAVAEALFEHAPIDAAGALCFANVPAGRYRLHANAPGTARAVSPPFCVREGEDIEPPPLVLGAGGHLTGAVFDAAGRALAGADVIALDPTTRRSAATARTGDDGAFAFDGLPLRDHVVIAHRDGFVTSEATATPGAPPLSLALQRGFDLRVHAAAIQRGTAELRWIGPLATADLDDAVDLAALGRRTAELQAATDARGGDDLHPQIAELQRQMTARVRARRDRELSARLVHEAASSIAPCTDGEARFSGLDAGVYEITARDARQRIYTARVTLRASAEAHLTAPAQ